MNKKIKPLFGTWPWAKQIIFGHKKRKKMNDKVTVIAKIAHEVNRAYCLTIGDDSQKPWDEASNHQKESVINGVEFLLDNPDATPQESHENWVKSKIDAGWKYGVIKNEDEKTHPCLVDYKNLPQEHQSKDLIFTTVVKSINENGG